ncbi:MAG TPA: hypothetical protein VGN69_04630, partial [Solirubrobacteraceae bacterium]|nr:hypothetical protein [Solirubrobacteraceae bacterium]
LFELLVVLGRLGFFELEAPSLYFDGGDGSSVAAKRIFGIGDRLHLQRRAADLAAASELPLEALDLALHNWEAERRATLGARLEAGDEDVGGRVRRSLGL